MQENKERHLSCSHQRSYVCAEIIGQLLGKVLNFIISPGGRIFTLLCHWIEWVTFRFNSSSPVWVVVVFTYLCDWKQRNSNNELKRAASGVQWQQLFAPTSSSDDGEWWLCLLFHRNHHTPQRQCSSLCVNKRLKMMETVSIIYILFCTVTMSHKNLKTSVQLAVFNPKTVQIRFILPTVIFFLILKWFDPIPSCMGSIVMSESTDTLHIQTHTFFSFCFLSSCLRPLRLYTSDLPYATPAHISVAVSDQL